jgi:hypothetical protein
VLLPSERCAREPDRDRLIVFGRDRPAQAIREIHLAIGKPVHALKVVNFIKKTEVTIVKGGGPVERVKEVSDESHSGGG